MGLLRQRDHQQAYKDNVWAILGTIDGANTHIAIRVALKAEILMMNTRRHRPHLHRDEHPVDDALHRRRPPAGLPAGGLLLRKLDSSASAIIRASNRYGRFGVREIRDSARRLGRPVRSRWPTSVGEEDFSLQLERLKEAKLDAVVHWGDAAKAR